MYTAIEGRIAQPPTVHTDQQPGRPKEYAPDRSTLDAQLAVAQTESATALAQLMRAGANGAMITEVTNQLANLAALKRQLETAAPGALPALQAEIAACVAASSALARDVSSARGEGSAQAMDDTEARAAARKTIDSVNQALFKDRIFDPYLQFASKEDEDAYRKREAERQAIVEKELAKDTSQGDLNALAVQREQMKDAGKNGAAKSPDFERYMDSLNTSITQLESVRSTSKQVDAASAGPLGDLVSDADLARFRDTGTKVADQRGAGHGVSAARPTQRGPDLPG